MPLQCINAESEAALGQCNQLFDDISIGNKNDTVCKQQIIEMVDFINIYASEITIETF